MLRWLRVVASGGLLLAGRIFAQTGYQAEQLVPDPILKTPATLESMLMRAGYEQRHQDCLDAGFHIGDVLRLAPEWPGALAMRLQCERRENRRVDERMDLTKLIHLQPKNWRWWSERALVLEKDFDRKPALADLNEAIALRPWEVDLYIRRSYLEEDLRDYSGAFADLKKVHELLPEQAGPLLNMAARVVLFGGSEAEAVRLRRLAEIAAPTREDPARNDGDLYTDGMSAEEAMLRAGYARSRGDWPVELRFLNAALYATPGLIRALEMRFELAMKHPETMVRAKYHPRSRDTDSADRILFERQIRADGEMRSTLNLKLELLVDVGSLIAATPYRAEYRRQRIQILIRRGRFGLGQIHEDLDAVVAGEPFEGRSYAERGQFEMERNDLEGALNDFTLALAIEPSNALYSYQLSRVYAGESLIAAEITSLNLALVGEPENELWLRARAKLP